MGAIRVCWNCGDVGLEGSCSSLQGWKSLVGPGCAPNAWTAFGKAQNYSTRMILSKLGFSQSPQINSCRSPGTVICHFLGTEGQRGRPWCSQAANQWWELSAGLNPTEISGIEALSWSLLCPSVPWQAESPRDCSCDLHKLFSLCSILSRKISSPEKMTFIYGTKANHSSRYSGKGFFVTMENRKNLTIKWGVPPYLQALWNVLDVFVWLVEKPHRQLGEQKLCPLGHSHAAQAVLLSVPSRAVLGCLRHSWRMLMGLWFCPVVSHVSGLVVIPHWNYQSVLQLASFAHPQEQFGWLTGRTDCGSLVVSLWHPSLWLSCLVELLPSFCLTLSLLLSEGSHSSCVRQDLGCLVEHLLHVCFFQWNLVDLWADFCPRFSPQIFFFSPIFLTMESILLAPGAMNHPAAPAGGYPGCPFLLPEADQGKSWS